MFSKSNVMNLQETLFKKSINIILAVIIASSIIIIITTNMTDKNALSALIGGYSGLLLGILFIILLNFVFKIYLNLDMLPLVMIIIIVAMLISYLSIYFNKIASGEVSNYYSNFSILSTILLFTQLAIIFNAFYNKNQSNRAFTNTTISLLGLFSVINILIVITMGIILQFYSTQG